MKTISTIIMAAVIAAQAHGQTAINVTNSILDSYHAAISGNAGKFRITSWITDGVSAFNLDGYSCSATIASWYDGEAYSSISGTVMDAASGKVRWYINGIPSHTYRIVMSATNASLGLNYAIGNHVFTVNPDPLVITNDFTVNVAGSTTTVENTTIVTTLVEIAEGAISNNVTINITQINTNIYQGDTFATNPIQNASNVKADASPATNDALVWNGEVWTNAPIESGSGTLTNGIGTNGITVEVSGAEFTAKLPDVIPSSDQFLRSDGAAVFWSTARWPLPSIGTNVIVFEYITDEHQYWTVPEGVTNVEITCIGGGGAGYQAGAAAGGGSVVIYDVGGISTLTVIVAQGGRYGEAVPNSAWYGGGTNEKATAVGGGGLSGVYESTNWLLVAGGGGTGRSNAQGGAGGGVTGGDAWYYGGKGGSQTAGGLGADGATNLLMGGHLCGGTSTNSYSGSGGGGWYGGGAGDRDVSPYYYTPSGGGSGYISPNAIFGITVRGQQGTGVNYPPFADDPLYVAGVGVSGNSSAGGNGEVWIKW